MPSLPPAALRYFSALVWPRPRDPKCTPIQTGPSWRLPSCSGASARGGFDEEVDVVVARPDGAQLVARFRLVRLHVGAVPSLVIVEEVVLDALLVHPAHTERDRRHDLAVDVRDPIGDRVERCVQPHGQVAAADVEAHARDADLTLVGDHAADRLSVAEMAVGTDDAGHHVAETHAVAHLRDRALLMVADHRQRRVTVSLGLRRQLDRSRLGDDLLGSRRARERAPGGHATVASRLGNPRVRVETRRCGELARPRFKRIATSFGHDSTSSSSGERTRLARIQPVPGRDRMK